MAFDAVKLSQELIKYPSVTQEDAGVIAFMEKKLSELGFKNDVLHFEGDNSYPVTNLHSVFNPSGAKDIFYFAGHTDVVATGKENLWTYPPFAAQIVEGRLYGRGASDMKCAIACFMTAVSEFLEEEPNPNFGIGLLITGDEEAEAVNGTVKMLDWMQSNNKTMSACMVGEPTSVERVGDMAKIGRRGSASFSLKVIGKQGHVAYPHNANNPITTLANVLKILKDYELDKGNKFFDASNLEVTNISSPDVGGNVIPEYACANFNVRFNNEYTPKSLIEWVKYVCDHSIGEGNYELNHNVSGESFITKTGPLTDVAVNAIKEVTGLDVDLSTTGGTSDARFIKNLCPVFELGLQNKTAHQIDENVAIADVEILKNIYKKILELLPSLYESSKS